VRYTTPNSTLPTRYTYTGQYSYIADDATDLGGAGFGLMFYNARWYDPVLGRFAQADSIVPGGVQGWDRYAYTKNNPIRYIDPSGHDVCDEEGNCYNSQGWYRAPHAPRLSGIDTWKMMILSKFGITMSEEADVHNANPKAWNTQNLQIVWKALNQIINEALNGKLKSLAGGATFKWGDYDSSPCGGGGGVYCGYTYGTTVTFYNIGQAAIRLQNIFHEFGHVLDNSSKTYNAFSHADGINNSEFLDDNGQLEYSALINKSHDMYQDNLSAYTGDMVKAQNEHWADMFANYVAGNINLTSPEGQAMNGTP